MSEKSTLCLECFTENNPALKQCWRCHRLLNPNPEKTSNGMILANWDTFFSVVKIECASLCKPLSSADLIKFDGFHYDCTCGARLVFNPRDYALFPGFLWQLPENRIAFPSIHGGMNSDCGMICVKPRGFWIKKGFDTVFGCKKPVKTAESRT